MQPAAWSPQKCHLLSLVGVWVHWVRPFCQTCKHHSSTQSQQGAAEDHTANRRALAAPSASAPHPRAPVPSLRPFVYPSESSEDAPSCPGPKPGCLLPSKGGKHQNLPPRPPELGISTAQPWARTSLLITSPASYLVSCPLPSSHHKTAQGIFLNPKLNSASSLLGTTHGSPSALKVQVLIIACKSLGGLAPGGPSASLSATPDAHPHPVVCSLSSPELLPGLSHSAPHALGMPTGTALHPAGPTPVGLPGLQRRHLLLQEAPPDPQAGSGPSPEFLNLSSAHSGWSLSRDLSCHWTVSPGRAGPRPPRGHRWVPAPPSRAGPGQGIKERVWNK